MLAAMLLASPRFIRRATMLACRCLPPWLRFDSACFAMPPLFSDVCLMPLDADVLQMLLLIRSSYTPRYVCLRVDAVMIFAIAAAYRRLITPFRRLLMITFMQGLLIR